MALKTVFFAISTGLVPVTLAAIPADQIIAGITGSCGAIVMAWLFINHLKDQLKQKDSIISESRAEIKELNESKNATVREVVALMEKFLTFRKLDEGFQDEVKNTLLELKDYLSKHHG